MIMPRHFLKVNLRSQIKILSNIKGKLTFSDGVVSYSTYITVKRTHINEV